MNDIQIRVAGPDDAGEACSLLRRTIAEVCALYYNNDETVLSEWLSNKTPENVMSWINSESTYSIVAVNGHGDIVGFAILSVQEITLLYLLPEVLYKGVGKRMLQSLEEYALKTGIKRVKVMSSIPARAFYERNGYISNGEPEFVGPVLGHFPLIKTIAG